MFRLTTVIMAMCALTLANPARADTGEYPISISDGPLPSA